MDKNDYMQRAIDLAREKMREGTGYWPYGCVIVKDGEIVGEGCNDMGFSLDPTGHGEIVALRDACKRLGTMDPHRLRALHQAASPARSAPARSG